MKITIQHMRQAKYCNRGARLWFAAHGMSFSDFRKNGVDADIVRKLGDPMGLRLVEIATNGR